MKQLPIALAALLMSVKVCALEVTLTQAGTLENNNISADTESLTISGPVNAADLYFIGDNLKKLKTLDLSKATITEYDNIKMHSRTTYPAATIPPTTFAGSALETVVLPQSSPKITIADAAFASTSLRAIDLANVDSVGCGAFASCKNLAKVTAAPQRTGEASFINCTALTTFSAANLTELPAAIFSGCTALQTITETNRITAIGNEACLGCSSLKEFEFSPEITVIGQQVFEMSGLTKLNLEDTNLTTLGNRSFAKCPALTSAKLPATLMNLGTGTFFDDTQLTDITLPNSLNEIPDRALKGSGISGAVLIPQNTTTIGKFAFAQAHNIESVDIPAGVSLIDDYAMENLTSLNTVNVTQTVAVPQLGTDVWNGVDKEQVKLKVNSSLEADYRAAQQWQDFRFDVASAVEDIEIEDSGAPLRARFVGYDLEVSIDGAEISSLSLYNAAGQLLVSVQPYDSLVVIDTRTFADNIFIITATMDNGSRKASLKIARR